jgi:uncharacterized SAM-binding protein YcdF (DUF218 family)
MEIRLFKRFIDGACLALGIACFGYYLACGLAVRFNQSMLWVWPAAGTALVLKFIIAQIARVRGVLPYPKWFLYLLRTGTLVALAVFLLVEAFVISGMFARAPAGVDYLIVLGAKTGSVALDKRIAVAAAYLLDNPETIAIGSGGQGPDEEMSEARYIEEALVAHGVPRERIMGEDRSVSTNENIRFSASLVADRAASVAVVSSDYHVFRAMQLAKQAFEGDVYALPARSSGLTLPHYLVREFFTTVVDAWKGNLAFF